MCIKFLFKLLKQWTDFSENMTHGMELGVQLGHFTAYYPSLPDHSLLKDCTVHESRLVCGSSLLKEILPKTSCVHCMGFKTAALRTQWYSLGSQYRIRVMLVCNVITFLRCLKVPNNAFASSCVLTSENPQRKRSRVPE
jgi:hypothetical protein